MCGLRVRYGGRPITQTGALLSILSELDVEEADLLGFRVDDPLAAQNGARRQAVANAKKVARIIADEAGSVLGAPVKITYGRDSRRYRSLGFADEDRPAPRMAARQPVRPKVEVNLAEGG
ncbi:MAG: SIMPL domain-containing protein [Alphaproteobacteria bacterium]